MPTTVTWPPRRVARQAARMVAARPTHSRAWSTPRPPVRDPDGPVERTSSASRKSVAPAAAASSALAGDTSTAMHRVGAGRPGGGDRGQADPAEADHGHRLAGADPGGAADRAGRR